MEAPNGQQLPELTRDDIRKIEKSMRKPEFMGLLNEYMVEISDPKNKNEYDEWLRQMEREGQLPKHMQLIQPKPQFCIKTTLTSHRSKQQEMKFFINMCSAQEIDRPGFEPYTNDRGETGQNWRIPNSMGKIRYDQDKRGDVCNTVDAVFHPDTFLMGHNKSFQAMMISIALDTAQKQLGERKQTISKDYVVLQNVKCKGGEPALLPVRRIQGRVVSKGEGEPERDRQGRETALQRQINEKKQQHEKEEENRKRQKQAEEQQMRRIEEQLKQESTGNKDEAKGPARPKYQAIYSYAMDYGDFIDKRVDRKKKIPSSYALEFKLPKLSGFSEIRKLDVSGSKLVLDAGDKYFIDLEFAELKLSFKLLTSQSKAKFDKKKKTLRVTFDIDKSSIVQQPEDQLAEGTENGEAGSSDAQQGNAIQQETWKDAGKLLEITQNKVATQFLQPAEEPREQPKQFVQEIDEDDEESRNQSHKESAPQAAVVKKNPAASVSTKPISYKFQETAQSAFVVIHLPKYSKEDAEVVLHQQKVRPLEMQILVKWKRGSGVDYYAVSLRRSDFVKHEIRFIVEYVVVKLDKSSSAFWETTSVAVDTESKILSNVVAPSAIEEAIQCFKQAKSRAVEEVREEKEVVPSQATSATAQSQPLPQKLEVTEASPHPTPVSAELPKQTTRTLQFIQFRISLVDELD